MKDVYTANDGSKYEITYSEHNEKFHTTVNGVELSNQSLKLLRDQIDRRTSPKAKATRIPAIYSAWGNEVSFPVIATSLDRYRYVRISHESKDKWGKATRERDSTARTNLFADTPANREIMDQMNSTLEQIQKLEEQHRQLREKLEDLDLKPLEEVA